MNTSPYESVRPTPPELSRWGIADFVAQAATAGFAYNPVVLESATGPVITHGNRRLINFASCSLLGMHVRQEAVDSFTASAARYGLATGGSRMIQGRLRPLVDLEQALGTISPARPAA